MKFAVFLLLSLFAFIGAEEECSDEKVEACVDSLVSSLIDNTGDEEVCKELKKATECLRSEVDKCFEDGPDKDVEEGLNNLDNIFKENCNPSAINGAGEECSEEKVEACVVSLFTSMTDNIEEVCKEMKKATECLRSEVNNCFEDGSDEDFEEALNGLENLVKENCDTNDDDASEELEKCVEENKDDMNECIEDRFSEEEIGVIFSTGFNKSALQCIMYFKIVDCYLEKVHEKCGKEAFNAAVEVANNHVPEDITEACKDADLDDTVYSIEEADTDDTIHSIHLIADDRKKK